MRATKMVTNADYCRYHGLVVGDVLQGNSFIDKPIRLAIKYIGSSVVVFDEFRLKNNAFTFERETANWSLFERRWEKVIE